MRFTYSFNGLSLYNYLLLYDKIGSERFVEGHAFIADRDRHLSFN